ncbi:hypothetical protein LUZ60_000239 [Juncus effusus]|nr:hypothetical protein LUZ60_000239 [Juncus effusus]
MDKSSRLTPHETKTRVKPPHSPTQPHTPLPCSPSFLFPLYPQSPSPFPLHSYFLTSDYIIENTNSNSNPESPLRLLSPLTMRPDRRSSTTATTSSGAGDSNRRVWVPRGGGGASSAAEIPPNFPQINPSPNPNSSNVNNFNHGSGRNRYSNNPRPNRTRYTTNNNNRRPQPQTHQPRPAGDTAAPAVEGVPQLVQEIQEKLARGAVECMICYDMVRRSAPIWSCSSCFSIFHLACARKWARSPSSIADTITGGWRCPGCQSVQSVPSKDLSYTCFCGRRNDPPNDLYLTPHSCGEPCGRPLYKTQNDEISKNGEGKEQDGVIKCPHMCVLQCHPGPCPPCKAFAPRRPCPCGKNILARRCADLMSPVSCGHPCGRPLDCGRHRCEKICHTGSCEPCKVLVTASCFCTKKTEMVLCGEMAVKGDLKDIKGVFSCNSVCGMKLNCGNHNCRESCHPGPCGDCKLLPSNIKTCHCGKTPLENPRNSCLDPIPTCSQVCNKLLPCGTHYCKDMCHEGICSPCMVKVDQKCRCGSTTRHTECHRVTQAADLFLCTKQCGRKKNCGRHRCSEYCCPLSRTLSSSDASDWDPHLCSVTCGKKLRCGNHSCQLLCHSGHCPPCFETIFTDLTCACGKTIIPPPLPCGTPRPTCTHPCVIEQPCGHRATHACHFGPCPPCVIPVPKECIGGHVLLKNIPCGSREIRCSQLCGKTRSCGLHACGRPCHAPPCDATESSGSGSSEGKPSCGQVCGAPRRECKHTCVAPCHPNSLCPDLRCEFLVTISCSCGRISSTVPCSAGGITDSSFELGFIQKLPVPLQPLENGKRVPLGQRKLSCDEECAKLERRRVLADAFDINQPNLDSLHLSGENSSELISDLMRREPKWVMAIEERCKYLVLSKSKGGSTTNMKVHVFCNMLREKREAVHVIADRWKLSVHAAGWEPKRFLVAHVTTKSKAPQRILGTRPGAQIGAANPPAFDPTVDMDPRLVVAMMDLPREADVSALVLRFGGECELAWLNDRNALAVFNDPARAATALRRLDYGSVYHGAVVVQASGSNSAGVGTGTSVGAGTRSVSNPWKKALVNEVDPWGENWSVVDQGGSSVGRPGSRGKETGAVTALNNRWTVLGSESGTSSTGIGASSTGRKAEVVEVKKDEGEIKNGEGKEEEEEVDDWEKGYWPSQVRKMVNAWIIPGDVLVDLRFLNDLEVEL